METINVEIAKYTYIDKFFLWLGFSQEISSLLALIITFCIISLLVYWGKAFFIRCKTHKASRDLAPYYNEYSVKRATKYFISTNGQNISPTKEEEPAIGIKFITREKLIPFFINNVFQGKKESDKFYLILADSGMGKTTFLINLYIKYNSIFNFTSKYNIKMLPFGEKNIIQRIKDIAYNQDNAKNTILLLDAFDEYKGLLPPKTPDGLTDDERFRKQLDEIFEITRDFRNVIITSRTQYFPAQEEIPYELNIPRFGKEGFHKLSKLYISPFNEKDIKKYLNKKFRILKFWNLKKKSKAKKITGGDSHKLMVRPMLLSYIDYLVDEDKNYENTFDIYDTLIKKWIEREGNKRKFDNEVREKFKDDLLKFSKLSAIEIYKSGEYSKGIDKNTAQNICKEHNINLEGYEITGQSLLTRDVATNWKFAHKSIYEFFIAENAIKDVCFSFNLNATSLDMTKKFVNEKSDSSLYLFNYISINNRNNFYISDKQISKNDVKLIMGYTKNSYEQKFTKSESILYCNNLNEKFGYKIRYDDTGVLRDENNKKIDPTKIKGFIFPTINEFESLLKFKFNIFSGFLVWKPHFSIYSNLYYCSNRYNIYITVTEKEKKERKKIELLDTFEGKIVCKILPEWTAEMLKESNNKFNLSELEVDFKEEVYTNDIERQLRLVFVNNLT